MACNITATSVIPLWYGDEDGNYPIPATIDTCPMDHGMGFSIAVSKDSYNSAIAHIHVDTMDYRKVPFDETINFPGYEGRYVGYVECNGTARTIHVTLTDYPPQLYRLGQLHIVTDPPEATVAIEGVEQGVTPIEISIPFGTEEYRKKVEFDLSYAVSGAFKDKTRRKTVRPGLVSRYLTRLSSKARIKGKTKKDSAAKSVTFTMWAEDRITHARIAHAQLYLLNMTNMKRVGSLVMPGSYITIPYSSDFFEAGKNKLVCYWGDTGDRIRAFRTITITKVAGDSIGKEEDWHEENDDTSDTTSDARRRVNDAYARVGN